MPFGYGQSWLFLAVLQQNPDLLGHSWSQVALSEQGIGSTLMDSALGSSRNGKPGNENLVSNHKKLSKKYHCSDG
jgi:hypothetical protein